MNYINFESVIPFAFELFGLNIQIILTIAVIFLLLIVISILRRIKRRLFLLILLIIAAGALLGIWAF